MKSLKTYKAIGLMSGTSMDGIDAAWIETDGLNVVSSLGGFSIKYTPSFYKKMKAMEHRIKANVSEVSSSDTATIIRQIDDLHIQAIVCLCEKYHINKKEIACVGYHGQTVFHQPLNGISIQLGSPQYLTNQLDMPVMGNVRQNDIKLGGQGAPIAPIYHQALVNRDHLAPAAVINCGGISNVSLILGEETSELYGFDAGPGNGLLDRWVNKKTLGKEQMDKDGKYALAGKVNPVVLAELKNTSCIVNGINYYTKIPPKSLDIRDFNWLPSFEQLSLEDGCATLATFTAQCVIEAIYNFCPSKQPLKNIILVGGGWHHPVILMTLKAQMDKIVNIRYGDDFGWSAQYLEAELMAYTGVRCLMQLPITFPTTTAVSFPTIGGNIFYPEK